MGNTHFAIKIENLSKQYRLGQVGTGSLAHDLNRWWHLLRGKEDPYTLVGEVNDRSVKATSDYVWALKDINLKVEEGEVLGIIGRNGAGKSTLLKLISRITAPSTGTVKVRGRIASLLEVGTGMHPEMTARENIFLNGAILGMTRVEVRSKFDEIVDFAGIAKYIDTPTKRFSSGMRVRLGFAVAAFLEPEVLIIDEVLAVGDVEFQKKAIGKMQEISQGGGRTVLFVSHNMSAIQNLCTRTVILENGMIEAEGNSHEMVKKYTNLNLNDYNQNSIDFFKNVNRRGSSLALFRDIKIRGKNPMSDGFVVVEMDEVSFDITIETNNKLDDDVIFMLHFIGLNFNEIISTTKKFKIEIKKGVNEVKKFTLTIPCLNLRPGQYGLSFWLGNGKPRGKYDQIDKDLPNLTVLRDNDLNDPDYDPTKVIGYFNMENQVKVIQ